MPQWLSSLAVYGNRRVLPIGLLGFSSGLPLALTASTLSLWLAEAGVNKTSIGLFASVATPYTLKFAWAPLVDRMPLPVLTARLGQRRSWLLASQAGLMLALLMLGSADPRQTPGMTALWAVAVAFFSATQDIAVDAFRVERLAPEEQGAGAGIIVLGYRLGMLVSGAGALYLATWLPWSAVYAAMAGFMAVGMATVLACDEPIKHRILEAAQAGTSLVIRLGTWLRTAVVAPLQEFATRPGWGGVLSFVLVFKLGDALAGVMTNPFLIELGFTKIEIANVVKTFGMAATLVGTVLGGALVHRVGVVKALWIGGGLQLASNGVFALQATVGHSTWMLAVTIGFENLAGGVGTAAYVAYLSGLCNVAYTATQYALLTSIAAMARTWLASSAGWGAEHLGWVGFFLATMVAALPGLLLLPWLGQLASRSLDTYSNAQPTPQTSRPG